jgi:inner membrane protein
VLYKSRIKISGRFPGIKSADGDEEFLTSTTKYLSFNISDLRGIEETVKLRLNKTDLTVVPGLKDDRLFTSGVLSYVDISNDDMMSFECELNLRGSSGIEFMPLGKMTNLHVKSNWNNPSFTGSYLPTTRTITDSGFTSEWKINHFNREYPQTWNDQHYDLYQSAFGVNLIMPVDEYQKTMRTSKYGMMIIVLTFISFFLIEIFSNKIIHPVQYLLVGLSLVIFYSLLLAVSEYIIFKYSYLISSAAVIALIGLYIKSVYSSVKISLIITSILTMFYGLMYIILQMQDYALLFGNIALFLILGIIMYLTRKLNWFELFNNKSTVNKDNV